VEHPEEEFKEKGQKI